MANTSTSGDVLAGQEPKKMPETIKVVSVLTFIGSGLAIIFGLWGFSQAKASYDRYMENRDKMDQMPSFLKNMMGPHPEEYLRNNLDNRLPILLITVVGAILCIYGAMMMRQLKKAGFGIYVIGELLPFLSIFLFIGLGNSGMGGLIFGCVIALVFILLYASQLKHMK